MTPISPLHSNPLLASQANAAASSENAGAASTARANAPKPEILKAAREFESIFLRSLLGSLEKTTQVGGQSSIAAGQSAYGSMVVGAMADSMSSAGGIGLADVIAKALSNQALSAKEGAKKP